MTNKAYKLGKLENEIERLRSDCNWARLMDLSIQNAVKTSLPESVVRFLQLESKLERCLVEGGAFKGTSPMQASSQLQTLLSELTELNNLNTLKSEHRHESKLLQAKVHYHLNEHSQALSLYQHLNLPSMSTSQVTSRRLRLIGEAFAIKGLCLERVSSASAGSLVNEDLVIECFEKSGDISLCQLQERQQRYKTLPATVESSAVGLSPLVEQAIFRYPVLYIRKGELQKGISKLRDLMMVVESRAIQGLRVSLAKQLAEVLLRGVCGSTYTLPQTSSTPTQTPPSLTQAPPTLTQTPPTPPQSSPRSPKPTKHSNENMFVPADKDDEALLLILISEAMATREVVLNRSSELQEARCHTLHRAVSLYDLLAICLARKSNYNLLSETFEKATRFSFKEHHVWYQFALSLMCNEKYSRAYLVLKECMKLKKNDVTQKLLAAKLCYEHLNYVDEGLQHSQEAVVICQTTEGDNTSLGRCHLHVGMGRLLQAQEARLMKQRGLLLQLASEALSTALSIDPSDHLNHFYMAYYLALVRKIPEALARVRRALQLRRNHMHSLHLLVLLLSAHNMSSEASNLLEATLLEYPNEFSLLFSKSQLDMQQGRLEAALQANRRMLVLWKQMFQLGESEDKGTGLLERITGDQRSLMQLQFCEMADRDSGRAESAAASRLEQALSEVASSLGSNVISTPSRHHSLQARVWLSLAEVYLTSGKHDSARACMEEASALNSMSHVLFYMKGQLEESLGRCKAAQQFYLSALAINPRHVKSLIRLGVLLHQMGNNRLAEMSLRKAVNTDPMCTSSWRALGQVLQSLGDEKEASECLSTALSLQATQPVLPFHVLHAQCA